MAKKHPLFCVESVPVELKSARVPLWIANIYILKLVMTFSGD